jgi:prepilin-type N-terminal cleavage/methylation domain-containing protein
MKPKSRVSGFTLVELLVSIAILSLITALLVPRLRLVTKERGIRETARMVGSQIVDAVIRAKTDGAAGIALVRNQNYFRKSEIGSNIYYSSSSIFQLRQRRPYCGNDLGDTARVSRRVQGFVYELEIPAPYDPSIAIEKYATIQLGSSSVEHLILNVSPTPGSPMSKTLQVQFHPPLPLPEIGQLFSFVISRRPEISTTTEVVLPRGYQINLNYSGYAGSIGDTDNNTWTSLSLDQKNNDNSKPIYILFDDNGGVDRIFTNGWDMIYDIPISSIYLCVAPDEQRHSFSDALPLPRSYYDELTAAGGPDLLNEPSLIWVAVNHLNGSVGVGENGTVSLIPNPAPTGAALADLQELRIRDARKIASKRRVTNQ